MKFEDMSVNIQEIAASTLSEAIKSIRLPQGMSGENERYRNDCAWAAKCIADSFIVMAGRDGGEEKHADGKIKIGDGTN